MERRPTDDNTRAITVAMKLLRLQFLLAGTRVALAGKQASERDIGRAMLYLGEAWECANAAFEEAMRLDSATHGGNVSDAAPD